jgi:hypothetical protein
LRFLLEILANPHSLQNDNNSVFEFEKPFRIRIAFLQGICHNVDYARVIVTKQRVVLQTKYISFIVPGRPSPAGH